MKTIVAIIALFLAFAAKAATTINVTTNVAVSEVHRFGIDLAQVNYYDSGQMMKELLFRNPGFEGLIYQAVVPIHSGTATNAIEEGAFTQWPSGFWNGANYEFIWGKAKGRAGTIAHSLAPLRASIPNDLAGDTNGTTYVFNDSGASAGPGDYMILRKRDVGGTNSGSAFNGWSISVSGGGTATSELIDLPLDLNPSSKQCARLSTTAPGQSVLLSGSFDTWNGASFVQITGSNQLVFKAKGVAGANQLLLQVRRGSGPFWINKTISLTNVWALYTNTFSANEDGTAIGPVSVQFAPLSQSTVLIDDVSLRQIDSDPANSSEFRDAVVKVLRDYHPGFLRFPNWQQLGDTLDNELAPPFARMRTGYSSYAINANGILLGLPEFLGLCELVDADPWFPMPITYSPQEMSNLMEYLGGPTNTTYGLARARLEHPTPWTDVFRRIHIEFGNESWNPTYRGASIANTDAYGNRGSELFGAAKASLYYTGSKFNFILGDQWVVPWRVRHTHDASANHDTMTVAGYMASTMDNFSTTEELFGSVFAEPEWWSKSNGLIYQDYTNILYSSRPVPISIYEVNINVPGGAIVNSQAALSAYTPSLGAGLAVVDHMLMMLREVKARDQGLFALPGYEFNAGTNRASVWGVVRDMGVTNRKRPQYLGCQLANEILGGSLLQTVHTGDDPTWSVNNINHVTYSNAHHIQSYAFANAATNAIVVFNLHRTDALDINFAGALVPNGSVVLKQLTSSAITNNNETAETVFVTTQNLTGFDGTQPFSLPPFSMSVFEWKNPAAALAAPEIQADGTLQIRLTGITPNLRYDLQTSANLIDWMTLPDGGSTGANELKFTIPPPQTSVNFYRAFQVPTGGP